MDIHLIIQQSRFIPSHLTKTTVKERRVWHVNTFEYLMVKKGIILFQVLTDPSSILAESSLRKNCSIGVLMKDIPYSAKLWRGKTLANR